MPYYICTTTSWSPLNDTTPRFWFDFNDTSSYTVNGSNYLDTATNKITTFSEHDVTSSDRRTDAQLKTTLLGYTCLKIIRSSAGYISVPLGVHTVDLSSFTYTFVFALDSTQSNIKPILFQVPSVDGEDIYVHYNVGTGQMTYRQNTKTTIITVSIPNDTIHIFSAQYNGSVARVYLNGTRIGKIAVSPTGVGVSQLFIGSADIYGLYPDYDAGMYVFDFCMSDNHEDITRLKYEGYFYHKYGKQNTLLATHPYLTEPPKFSFN